MNAKVKKRKITISLPLDHPIFDLADSRKRGLKLKKILEEYYFSQPLIENRLDMLDSKVELLLNKINDMQSQLCQDKGKTEVSSCYAINQDLTKNENKEELEEDKKEIVFDTKAFFDLG